ncbi:unnamed protein product [Candida verbasci]|uniref:NAD-dependent epimerase/dehydratase domain-containing protein n=1 Tax=Candida verbasci TaxID=1227364 RepID=A0A9W4XGC2_9ASCO|nr:unnamed protein product [Candida verbasci]
MSSNTTVFVSGATGFIAQHIVKLLIEQGYSVIGSVRSSQKGDQLKSDLKSLGLKSDSFSYEIVEDIVTKGAFDKALQSHPEISVFLHTASPFHFDVKDVKSELLDPAVEGTNNALNAIKTYGKNIKRVVVTSSFAAVGRWGKYADPEATLTEKDWNPQTWEDSLENPLSGYLGSKKFAEKAAWEFVEKNNVGFKLSTVLPAYVFGPQLYQVKDKSKLNTSSEILNGLIKLNSNDEIPDATAWFIDVRDVAKAHLVAFEKEEAAGQRLILAAEPFSNQKIVKIIKADFPQLEEKLPKVDETKLKDYIRKEPTVNSDHTKKILDFKYFDLKQSVDDSVAQILK